MPSKRKSSHDDIPINPKASKLSKSHSDDVPNPIQAPSQQSLVEEQVFLNVLIVRNILSFLSPDQLFKVRAVSKVLEEEATSLLLSNEQAQQHYSIKFTCHKYSFETRCTCREDRQRWQRGCMGPCDDSDDDSRWFHCTCWALDLRTNPESEQQDYQHSKNGTLKKFVQDCWKSSRRFPISHFTFCNNYKCDDFLLDFFKTVGEHITGLSFKTSGPRSPSVPGHFFISTQVLASILFEWTPNLRHLTLESTPWSPTQNLLANTNVKPQIISSLETLTLEDQGSTCSFGVVKDIIRSAPNLRRIMDPTLKFTEILFAGGKLHLTSQVFKGRWNDETIARYFAFNEARPGHFREVSIDFSSSAFEGRLDTSGVPYFWRMLNDTRSNLGKALNKMFQAGRQSLEKIGMLPFLYDIPNLEPLPVMEKVTTVHFQDDQRTKIGVRMVPKHQTLGQVFPNLTTLRLDHMKTKKEDNPLFQSLLFHRHHGVTSLAMENNILSSWIKRSSALFPNLTTLKIWNARLKNTPKIFCTIWTHLDGLEHLEINEACWMDEEIRDGRMDSAFTGFPVAVCKQLHKNLTGEGNVQDKENVDHLRENPSILNLHKLKTLKLGHVLAWCTSVTTVYALQPMIERQGLRVCRL